MCDSDKVFLLCLVENRGIKENPSKNKHIPSGGSVVGAVVEKLRRACKAFGIVEFFYSSLVGREDKFSLWEYCST